MRIHANLDCEARWAGVALPGAVAKRISLYASLLAALAPEPADVDVWAPAAIDPARLCAAPGWRPPTMHTGAPKAIDLAWAAPAAKAVNDRRLALALATERGWALPGARVIGSAEELAAERGAWVVKAPWTSAGRDRCHGEGPPTQEQRTRIARLVERFGALVFEPWMERVLDVGACARVGVDGALVTEPLHGLITDARGGFLGIDLAPPALLDTERAVLGEVVAAVGATLFAAGYTGPFAIDAFVHRGAHGRALHPLCEINARYTFGWIAHALRHRLGTTRLGFTPAPPDATTLIAPGDDHVTAWIA